jgi:hypothetical protein
MRHIALLLLAASTLQFQITDARGKKASGITLDTGQPDVDDWMPVSIRKSKGDAILVWPFEGRAKMPDGPEPVPAIVIQRGEPKALESFPTLAAMAVPVVLGTATLEVECQRTGFNSRVLADAFSKLSSSTEPFEKGIGLLYTKKPAEAADQLALALRERERKLTRVPSEIYPAAMLYGRALFESEWFDSAAVVFQKALKQRPSDVLARDARAKALEKAGKPEAAQETLRERE